MYSVNIKLNNSIMGNIYSIPDMKLNNNKFVVFSLTIGTLARVILHARLYILI